MDNGPKKERGPYLPSGYTLDETDPDAIVLRRSDGSEAFNSKLTTSGKMARLPVAGIFTVGV